MGGALLFLNFFWLFLGFFWFLLAVFLVGPLSRYLYGCFSGAQARKVTKIPR